MFIWHSLDYFHCIAVIFGDTFNDILFTSVNIMMNTVPFLFMISSFHSISDCIGMAFNLLVDDFMYLIQALRYFSQFIQLLNSFQYFFKASILIKIISNKIVITFFIKTMVIFANVIKNLLLCTQLRRKERPTRISFLF